MKKLILIAMFPILFSAKGQTEPKTVAPEHESMDAVQEVPAVKGCPYRKVAFSEVKNGGTYLVVTEYVKGTNDVEGITPETVVVLSKQLKK